MNTNIPINEFESIHIEVPQPQPQVSADGIHWTEMREGKEVRSGFSATWPVEDPDAAS